MVVRIKFVVLVLTFHALVISFLASHQRTQKEYRSYQILTFQNRLHGLLIQISRKNTVFKERLCKVSNLFHKFPFLILFWFFLLHEISTAYPIIRGVGKTIFSTHNFNTWYVLGKSSIFSWLPKTLFLSLFNSFLEGLN